ncbi:MAG: hypothetical protein KDC92_02100 [Bacteroidetes bacterium]|nr:hypothetical protein [Bacteroidota bacterium]
MNINMVNPQPTISAYVRNYVCMRVVLLLISLFGALLVNAQNEELLVKLKKGIEAIRLYQLENANKYFDEVYTHKNELNAEQLGEFLYYYSRAKYQLFIEMGNANKQQFASLDLQQKAYSAYNILLELNRVENKRWQSKAETQMRAMTEGLFEASLITLDYYFNSTENNPKKWLYRSSATGYISLAQTIDPTSYVSHELNGQLFFFEKDSASAAYHLDRCIELYSTMRKNVKENVRIADVANKRARMLFNSGLYDTASSLVDFGIYITEFEMKAIEAGKGTQYNNQEVNFSAQLATEIRKELNLLKLEIAANNKEKDFQEAIGLFMDLEDDLATESRYFLFRGQLVEDAKPFEALKHYAKAVELDDSLFDACYYAGALYFALADEYRQAAQKDEKNSADYIKNSFSLFNAGYPIMQQAHYLEPTNRYVLTSLYHVAKMLNKADDAAQYAELLTNK